MNELNDGVCDNYPIAENRNNKNSLLNLFDNNNTIWVILILLFLIIFNSNKTK